MAFHVLLSSSSIRLLGFDCWIAGLLSCICSGMANFSFSIQPGLLSCICWHVQSEDEREMCARIVYVTNIDRKVLFCLQLFTLPYNCSALFDYLLGLTVK